MRAQGHVSLNGVDDKEAEARLFSTSGGAASAGEGLARLLSGELLGLVGRTVGLDAIRLEQAAERRDIFDDPTLIAGDVDPAQRPTLAKRLGSNVELVYSQNLARRRVHGGSPTHFPALWAVGPVPAFDDQSLVCTSSGTSRRLAQAEGSEAAARAAHRRGQDQRDARLPRGRGPPAAAPGRRRPVRLRRLAARSRSARTLLIASGSSSKRDSVRGVCRWTGPTKSSWNTPSLAGLRRS